MSPEEIIIHARNADPGQTVVYHAEDKLLLAIRDAITQARAEMREEAARYLDEVGKERFESWPNPAELAAAIRKLEA